MTEKASVCFWLAFQKSVILMSLLFSELSLNQPKYCPSVSWQGSKPTNYVHMNFETMPFEMFIDKSNTIYLLNLYNNVIQIWHDENSKPQTVRFSNSIISTTFFVTNDGDIYLNNLIENGRVDKWMKNSTQTIPVKYFEGPCFTLFVDIDNNLYCSLLNHHQVVKYPLYGEGDRNSQIVAGSGEAGSTPDKLFMPTRIFVDVNSNLYVVDYGNQRVQLFEGGKREGKTVMPINPTNGLPSNYYTDIKIDVEGNLFILGINNHDISYFVLNEPQSIIVQSHDTQSYYSHIHAPMSMAFDSHGDIYVLNSYHRRLEKFVLAKNSCGKFHDCYNSYV